MGVVHRLEQLLVEQALCDDEEGFEVIIGDDIQIQDIGLAKYHPGVFLSNRGASLVDLLLPCCDLRSAVTAGGHCSWRTVQQLFQSCAIGLEVSLRASGKA
jgi:hypothetical protein